MRVVVLLFGFLGVVLTVTAAGAFFFYDMAIHWLVDQRIDALNDAMPFLKNSVSITGVSHSTTALFLFVAAVYGLFGAILAFLRCGKQGGVLMVLPVLGAAFMNPFSLPLTGLLMFSGFVSFFVGPLPLQVESDDD